MNDTATERRGGILDLIERIGNLLPDPATLFVIGAVLVMVVSTIGARMGWTVEKPVLEPIMAPVTDAEGEPVEVLTYSAQGRVNVLDTVVDPETGEAVPKRSPVKTAQADPDTGRLLVDTSATETVEVFDLLSREGLNWAISSMVDNFTGFHPLGVVLVAMLGIGVAEKTGCIGALLKALMLVTPGSLLTPATVFVGIMSSMAADAGYVILPPLAAALYKAVGRSPLVGLAAVFSGVSAGFSANLFLTALDPLLQGLTQEGAQIRDPGYTVNVACNYYFLIVSTILLTFVGWLVTALFVEPRFEKKPPEQGGPSPLSAEDREVREMSPGEARGLRIAAISVFVAVAGVAALVLVPGAALHGDGRWVDAIVPILAFLFLVPGVAYGIATSSISSGSGRLDAGIAKLMASTMADMGPYIVLAFFAAQFVAYFNESNLGLMLAITGGEALASAEVPKQVVLVLFILVVMAGNLFIGSASAKYAFFAPVFVPMFMEAGISPELTQAAYRLGDSVTNIIAPLNPYVIIILVFMQKYVPRAGIGTLISLMLPYAVCFFVIWTTMLLVWFTLGFDLGPDGPLTYTPPAP